MWLLTELRISTERIQLMEDLLLRESKHMKVRAY